MASHVTLSAAVEEFERICSKSPQLHTSLFEVKRRGPSGKTMWFRVFSTLYLMPLPCGRGEYLVPLRHQ